MLKYLTNDDNSKFITMPMFLKCEKRGKVYINDIHTSLNVNYKSETDVSKFFDKHFNRNNVNVWVSSANKDITYITLGCYHYFRSFRCFVEACALGVRDFQL